jgi:hypothetical protein
VANEFNWKSLIEAMKFDIEEGNFCDTLLEKIDNNDKIKNSSPPSSPGPLASDFMKSDLDLLKKLQTQIS